MAKKTGYRTRSLRHAIRLYRDGAQAPEAIRRSGVSRSTFYRLIAGERKLAQAIDCLSACHLGP